MSAARSSACFMRRALVALAVAGLALMPARADDPYPWLTVLRTGTLTIWVVRGESPSRPRRTVTAANAPKPVTVPIRPMQPMGYKEQTAGSFGQDASTFGQTASEYALSASTTTPLIATKPAGTGYTEQTAGSFGQPSSETGTAASNHGTAAGSFGTPASSVGTASSNYGRTAGSFGDSLSTIANAGNAVAPTSGAGTAGAVDEEQRRVLVEAVRAIPHERFPELELRVFVVNAEDLTRSLRAARSTENYPDLLIGTLPRDLTTLAPRFAAMVKMPRELIEGSGSSVEPLQSLVLLRDAPHVRTAHAFMVWAEEQGIRSGVVMDFAGVARSRYDAGGTAREAVERLAHGGDMGELADPQAAEFPPRLGPLMTTVSLGGDAPAGVPSGTFRVEVEDADVRGATAVVLLRVVVESDHSFGLAHPLAVLRRGADRRWRVLHVSLNLPAAQAVEEFGTMLHASPPSEAEAKQRARPVSQAAPADGDVRPPEPGLSWDNPGGMGLEVVEWQETYNDGALWSNPNLQLVEDMGSRLRTHVTAQFAAHAGDFRWRVWSVGAGGDLAITPWRTLHIR